MWRWDLTTRSVSISYLYDCSSGSFTCPGCGIHHQSFDPPIIYLPRWHWSALSVKLCTNHTVYYTGVYEVIQEAFINEISATDVNREFSLIYCNSRKTVIHVTFTIYSHSNKRIHSFAIMVLLVNHWSSKNKRRCWVSPIIITLQMSFSKSYVVLAQCE